MKNKFNKFDLIICHIVTFFSFRQIFLFIAEGVGSSYMDNNVSLQFKTIYCILVLEQ